MPLKTMGQKIHRTDEGFVYHELTFDFGKGKEKAVRYVPDEMWRARFADAHSALVIWNAVRKGEGFKKPPLQGRLL